VCACLCMCVCVCVCKRHSEVFERTQPLHTYTLHTPHHTHHHASMRAGVTAAGLGRDGTLDVGGGGSQRQTGVVWEGAALLTEL
jgi:hypothetical protein